MFMVMDDCRTNVNFINDDNQHFGHWHTYNNILKNQFLVYVHALSNYSIYYIVTCLQFFGSCIHKTKKVGESEEPYYTPMFLMKSMALYFSLYFVTFYNVNGPF